MKSSLNLFEYQEQNVKLKPFLKWAGGKTQLLQEIFNNIPNTIKEGKKFSYVEPFIGSGAVLFGMINNYGNAIEQIIINDNNKKLTNVYEVIKMWPDELIRNLTKIKKDFLKLRENEREKYYYSKRKEFNDCDLRDDKITNASLFIFLNKLGFNGLYRENSKGEFNVPYGKYTNPQIFEEELIRSISGAIQKIKIKNGDYADTIQYISNGTVLYYLDPPYKPISKTSSFNSYSKTNFDDLEQERLKSFCDLLTKKNIYFILSNSDVKNYDETNHYFDKLYKSYSINRVTAKRAINSKAESRGKINELLITNYTNKSYAKNNIYTGT